MDTLAGTVNPGSIFCIELTNGFQSIKEIYFANGNGSVFTYRQTKTALLAALAFAVLSGFFYLLSFTNQVVWIFLLDLSVWAVVGFILVFSFRAEKYFKWKKGVRTYLKELSKYDKQYLNLTELSFELINTDETIIEKWKNISKVSISPTHIKLNSESGSNYLFPAKSMEASKYEKLKEFISRKMKDTATNNEMNPADK
jgi:hypothetical protein